MKLFTIVSQSLIPIPPNLSNLERMVVGRAIGSSVLSSISAEWSIDKIVVSLVNFNSQNWWIFSIATIYIYTYYKFYQTPNERLDSVPIYGKWSRNIKELLFVLFMVFTRDIQNAI